jgi:hypothetical protein
LNIRALNLAAALAVVFASTSMADIVGSTYNFSASSTGTTTITSSGAGSYTDPTGAGFCVGPNSDNCTSSGMFGFYLFSQVSSTEDRIDFVFSGGTDNADGTFSIDLGNFVTLDGETITGVTYDSGNLAFDGDFSKVTWDGTDAIFTGTAGTSGYDAFGRSQVFFDVAVTPAASTPEPSSVLLFGTLITGLIIGLKKTRLVSR